MPVTLICPHCSKAVRFHKLPIDRCPACGQQIPEEMALEAEKTFVPLRPILLSIQLYLGYIVGGMLLFSLFMPGSTEPVDPAVYERMGVPPLPTLPVWLMLLLAAIKGIMILWSSVSLQLNQYRSRALLMIMCFVFLVPETALVAPQLAETDVGRTAFAMMATFSMLVLAAAYFYLYRAQTVVEYYNNIRHLETPVEETELRQG